MLKFHLQVMHIIYQLIDWMVAGSNVTLVHHPWPIRFGELGLQIY